MRFATADTPDSRRAGGLRAQRGAMLTTVTVAIGIVSLVPLAVLVSDGRIAARDLLSDPAELTGAPWYLGALSSVNLVVWAAAAAVYLVAGMALRHRSSRLGTAMLWLGALTLVWAMDDLFLLHEIVVPWALGIPQTATFGIYGAALALLAVRHRTVLLHQPEASLLLLAVVAFAASVTLDVLDWQSTARRLTEEGMKLLGALAWALFPSKVIVRSMTHVPRRTVGPNPSDARRLQHD